MKIEEFKIELDKDVFYAGEKVAGRLLIRTNDQHLDKNANAYIKLYDKLDIEWLENEIISFDVVKRAFLNRKKPFEVNHEAFFDRQNVFVLYDGGRTKSGGDDTASNDTVATDEESIQNDNLFTFAYPFEFQLPERLQGTINLSNAKCNYFIKAYLTDDETVSQHYQKNVNAFSEFFKSLTHKFCKQQLVILNRSTIPNELVAQKHIYEAHSPNMHVIVTLPKLVFNKGEAITMQIDVANTDKSKEKFEIHKIAIKINQMVKLTSDQPYEKMRLFDNLIAHKSRKSLHQNFGDCIVVDESIEIPKEIPSTSTRNIDIARIRHEEYLDARSDEHRHSFIKRFMNPIRVNYKLSLEFWKNFLIDELDIKIPILIEPEL